ncbi:MAG: patatin-like phospholipase family protein [Acidobacteriota bacterium]
MTATGGQEVVLALGGGGVRGIAHLGVLAEFEAAGVEVRAIAGTSSGALMGALWLVSGAEEAIVRVREFCRSGRARPLPDPMIDVPSSTLGGRVKRLAVLVSLLRVLLGRQRMAERELLDHVAFFLPDIAVEALRRPFVAVATDNATGDEVWISRGSLRLAVAASSAMPGLVRPIALDGKRVQDGGAVAEIPVRAARSLGGPVVAVEVSEGLPVGVPERDRLPRAMFRAAAMGWQALRRRTLAEAEAVVAPAVNHLHWADYRAADEAIAAGRAAGRAFLSGRS